MLHHLPTLLARARFLLGLPGGPPERLDDGEIAPAARAVLALHEGLIRDRALAHAATYDDARHLGAYLLWWWPQSYAKAQAALRLLPSLPHAPRILDLGAGPGPAAIAAIDMLGGEAVALDASGAALDEAGHLRVATVRHWRLGPGALPVSGEFDLVLAAHLLSELPGDRAALLREIAQHHLAPRGVLLLIEPALRETGRALLEVRDALLPHLRAVAPCLTQKPCPALASSKDWCTAEVRWDAPAHVRQLADATGLRADERLSFAAVAMSREAPAPAADAWRVVGIAPPEKGKSRVFVCSDAGRVAAVRLDRDRAEANAAFDDLGRGDLVELRGLTPRGDGLRLAKGSTVVRK